MYPVLFYTIIASFITSLISLIGIMFLFGKQKINSSISHSMVSFAAGVLISTAFMDVLSEALHNGAIDTVLSSALIGIVFSFIIERFVLWYHHHHTDTHNIKPSAYLVLVGDGIHNFIDGIALAATFSVSISLGIITTAAIITHEIPQELSDFAVLVRSGFAKKKALIYNFLSALTAVLGGILGVYLVRLQDSILPLSLAFTAGIFIYIATADLIPELHQDNKGKNPMQQVLPFFLGITLIVLFTKIIHS